mmetsp:Transcript_60265/g.173903  ORF Transcript_60265/g.173903 Transcript_60265/m.173903 type:complete len:250 (+) Transcript_60265:3171-3920(+)
MLRWPSSPPLACTWRDAGSLDDVGPRSSCSLPFSAPTSAAAAPSGAGWELCGYRPSTSTSPPGGACGGSDRRCRGSRPLGDAPSSAAWCCSGGIARPRSCRRGGGFAAKGREAAWTPPGSAGVRPRGCRPALGRCSIGGACGTSTIARHASSTRCGTAGSSGRRHRRSWQCSPSRGYGEASRSGRSSSVGSRSYRRCPATPKATSGAIPRASDSSRRPPIFSASTGGSAAAKLRSWTSSKPRTFRRGGG